jgi:hypothetical protein
VVSLNVSPAVVLDADDLEGIGVLLASALDDIADGAPSDARMWIKRAMDRLGLA